MININNLRLTTCAFVDTRIANKFFNVHITDIPNISSTITRPRMIHGRDDFENSPDLNFLDGTQKFRFPIGLK